MEKVNRKLANKIKKIIKNGEHPLIIIISGVNGVGKTTVAFHLSNILGIKQRVGLGSIVKTLIAMKPKNKDFLQMDNDFTSTVNISTLQKQSWIISKTVNILIKEYNTSRISSIIEGVQLLPRYLDNRIIQFHLQVTDSQKYREQLKSCDTRKPYNVSSKVFRNLLKIDELLKTEMDSSSVYLLDNSKSIETTINQILNDIYLNLKVR